MSRRRFDSMSTKLTAVKKSVTSAKFAARGSAGCTAGPAHRRGAGEIERELTERQRMKLARPEENESSEDGGRRGRRRRRSSRLPKITKKKKRTSSVS